MLQTIYTALYIRIRNKGIIQSSDALKILYTSAKHELGRYYGFYHYKRKCISLDSNLDQSIQKAELQSDEFISEISNDKSKELLSDIWEYIKAKDELTYRIFLLHYVVGLKYKECEKYVPCTYSSMIHRVYRTIEELKSVFKEELK